MVAIAGGMILEVFQRPRVAILATGNELVNPGEATGPGQIVNSNSFALLAQVIEAGGIPILLGIAKDDPKDLLKKIEDGWTADVLLISGGVSVGKYDFVKEVLSELGLELDFWRVSMKPGHPLAFAVHEGRLVFGLPGNPVSTLVTFEEFVRPALKKMGGHEAIFRPTVNAISKEDIRKGRDGKTHFIPIFGSDEVADVTGAGDTVIATFTLALSAGASFLDAAHLANISGGVVVMKRGAASVSQPEIEQALNKFES